MSVTDFSSGFSNIAIIGMGCRFPQAPNIGAYWTMLLGGIDAITEVPADRWNVDEFHDPRPATPCKIVTRNGGFVDDIDKFDPYFFGISPREAVRIDPQQRMLLEVAWEAMEQAGLRRDEFMGSRTGVFVGVCTDDYITMERGDLRNMDIYMGTGGSRGSTAGRLAFAFGLRGPVAAVDTACSSSLVALHGACNSLQVGDCDMALAGGVNVVLHPGTAIAFSQANLLSPDGRCKAFDASANGFVRSEGAGIVLLKPLSKALDDGDPIYAVIRATASNNDGSTSPYMTPSKLGQAELLRRAYERAGVAPDSIQYVEAHGTGTAVGDPIEVGALNEVFSAGRGAGQTCLLGSSKTNIGHLEAAAGVAGVIKTVLALRNRKIPPNLHFNTPNPDIPWADLPFRVPTEITRWPETSGPARAGVNSFGISGTNAHVVLEEAPSRPETASHDCSELLLLSAHTLETLTATLLEYQKVLAEPDAVERLHDLCYSAAARRTHHDYRAAFVGSSYGDLSRKLESSLAGEVVPGAVTGVASDTTGDGPVFVFSGIATQWPGMGLQLYETEPVFRDSLDICDRVIRHITGWSVLEEIRRPASESRLDQIDIMQPAIFGVQVALASLWRSWGVEPSAIVGHSLGEIAAAHVSGALSIEDAALIVCERSRLMHQASGKGKMAAVGLSSELVRERLAGLKHRVCIAVVNSPTSCVISGDADAVDEFAKQLEEEGIFCRLLSVDVACHSHHMEPLRNVIAERLRDIRPRTASIPLYSTLLGRIINGNEVDAEYWATNLREPVDFATVAGRIFHAGKRTFLELSPNPALLTPIKQTAALHDGNAVVLSSLRSGFGEREAMLESAGALFAHGARIDLKMLYPGGRFVPPPPFAWQRERFWFEQSRGDMSIFSNGTSASVRGTQHPLLRIWWQPADEPTTHYFETKLDFDSMSWLADHRVERMPLFPAAAYIEIGLAVSMELFGQGPRAITDLRIHKALFLSAEKPVTLQTVVRVGSSSAQGIATNMRGEDSRALSFACYSLADSELRGSQESSAWTLLASGSVSVVEEPLAENIPAPIDISAERLQQFPLRETGQEFYDGIQTGFEFGDNLRAVQAAWIGDRHAITSIKLTSAMIADSEHYMLHPALIDACLHSLIGCRSSTPTLALPNRMEKVELFELPAPDEQLWFEGTSVRTESGNRAQLALYGESGRCLLRITNYSSSTLHSTGKEEEGTSKWLYETRWTEISRDQLVVNREPVAHERKGWLIIGAGGGSGADLEAALEARGQSCRVIESFDIGTSAGERADYDAVVYLGDSIQTARSASATSQISASDLPLSATKSTLGLLNTLKTVADSESKLMPRVFVVTCNARDVGDQQDRLHLCDAALSGLARVAAIELRALRVTQVDIGGDVSFSTLVDELLNADKEQELALRGEQRYALRLSRVSLNEKPVVQRVQITDSGEASYRLESNGSGVFDDLRLRAVRRTAPERGEVEIRVAAVGLNFLDVLKGLNMAPGLPEEARSFGMECSGRIVRLGEDVHDLSVGDEVIAMDSSASGCFSAFLTTGSSAVFRKPASLSFAEAVTIPIAYQTAYYSLCKLAQLQRGESVLIHSAAGGVGLAAVNIAHERGAVVFATAGTEEKRKFLRDLGVKYVMNSRTLDFAREIMAYTNGRGVDVVINSLAGEAIPRSLESLATGGRFIEIGKRDIYADSKLAMLPFQRNLSFFAVDLLRMRMEKPDVTDSLTREIARCIHDDQFVPLPRTCFAVSDAAEAFRYMAKGIHIGKVVITLDESEVDVEPANEELKLRSDCQYIITGGLGALGLEFARTLVAEGARNIVLIGRTNPGADASAAIEKIRAVGARVSVVIADVGDFKQLSDALEEVRESALPIRGVIHAAGITDDGTIQQLDEARFDAVFAAKVHGSWNLHLLLKPDNLDFFVFFSSAASIFGGAGQANYAAANAFLDALALYRRRAGLTALSVNWGPWADVGMAAVDEKRGARLAERGFESIPVKEGTELLGTLLSQPRGQIAVMPINWTRWAESFPEAIDAPFVADLKSEWSHHTAGTKQAGVLQLVTECESSGAAVAILVEHLTTEAVKILRVPKERLHVATSLIRFGMDSLMAVELKNRIEGDFKVSIPAARLLQGPSVRELAEWLWNSLSESRMPERQQRPVADTDTRSNGHRDARIDDALIDVDELEDAEVHKLLVQMLEEDVSKQ